MSRSTWQMKATFCFLLVVIYIVYVVHEQGIRQQATANAVAE